MMPRYERLHTNILTNHNRYCWLKKVLLSIKSILDGVQLVSIPNHIVDCWFLRLYWVASLVKVLPLLTKL